MENENNAGKGILEQLQKMMASGEVKTFPEWNLQTRAEFRKALFAFLHSIKYQPQNIGLIMKPRRMGYDYEQAFNSEMVYNTIFKVPNEESYDGNKLSSRGHMEYIEDLDSVNFWHPNTHRAAYVKLKAHLSTEQPIGKVLMISTLGEDEDSAKAIQEGIDLWKHSSRGELSNEYLKYLLYRPGTTGILSANEEESKKIFERLKKLAAEPTYFKKETKDPTAINPHHNKKGGKKNRKGGRKF